MKLPVDLRIRGDYISFGKFMETLKTEGMLYTIEELRIRRKVGELPTLSFHVVFYLFMTKENGLSNA